MSYVTVTAGHSNTDPGAVAGPLSEAKVVTGLRNKVVHYLTLWGVPVRSDGTGDTNLPLRDAIAQAKGAALAVELHLNAAASPSANGVESIALPGKAGVARALSSAVVGVLGARLRGDGGYIDQSKSARGKLGFVEAGGVIVEVCFISNPEEMQALQAKEWLVAKAIAEVIRDAVKGVL